MAKHKEKTVEEILAEYQSMHGKPFKERIKKFEEFIDPDKAIALKLAHHAEYVVRGKPSDAKGFPGAYNESYKILDKAAESDTDKIDNIDTLTEILEKYVDVFLEKAIGVNFKKIVERSEKDGLSKEDIRKMKGRLFAQYHADDKGNPIDILSDQYIKRLKGKKKIELLEELKGIAEANQKTYTIYLSNKAREHLITNEDILDLHDYTTPKFEKAGFKHKDHPLTRSPLEIANDYLSLLTGQDLSKLGYKRIKKKDNAENN